MISARVIGSGSVQTSVSGSSTVFSASPTRSLVSVGVYSAGQSPLSGVQPTTEIRGLQTISPDKPAEMAWMSTRLDSGTFGISAKSSTGYVAVLWWDGTVQGFGSGNQTQYISVTRAVPASGAYARSAPKSVYVWPATSLTSFIQSGYGTLTGLACSSKKITALSVADCVSLAALSCDSNNMEHLDVSRCSLMTNLACHGNRLRSLDISTLPLLGSLFCQSNILESLDVSMNPAMQVLQCNSNSLKTLNLAYSVNLRSLFCQDNSIASLNLSSCPLLTGMNCSNNEITSLRALNVSFESLYGANIENNLLTWQALNQFYSDLKVAPPGQSPAIYAAGNPGAGDDLQSIATGKGYSFV